jgi:hypothetical protein
MTARKRPGRANRFWRLARIDDVRGPEVRAEPRGEVPARATASDSQMPANARKALVASEALLVWA